MKIKLVWFWYYASSVIAGILCMIPAIMCRIKINTLWLSAYIAVIPIVIALFISWCKLFDKYDIW